MKNPFDKLIKISIEKSPIVLKMATLLEKIAFELAHLSAADTSLEHTVHTHNNAIIELYTRQKVLLNALKSTSDGKLPDIKDKAKSSSGSN